MLKMMKQIRKEVRDVQKSKTPARRWPKRGGLRTKKRQLLDQLYC